MFTLGLPEGSDDKESTCKAEDMSLIPGSERSPGEGNGNPLRESFPRQVDRESRGPHGERGLEFSRRKKGQTFFPSLHSLGLYSSNVSCLRTVSGLNLLANSVILKCILWE